jgi:hypothetical protein
MFRRAFAHFMLTFALLLAQQGGFAHELSHFAHASSPTDKQLPHSKACEQCASYSQLGTGFIAQPVFLAAPDFAGTAYLFCGVEHPAPRFFSHLSRAPPSLA